MDDTISVQNIRNFIERNGGLVTHTEITTFFKRPLTDPLLKDRNRNEFKDILLKIAIIGNENGKRHITLKGSSNYCTFSSGGQRSRSQDTYTEPSGDGGTSKVHKMFKSTESLDDDFIIDMFENEGLQGHCESNTMENPAERAWLMLSSSCDCQSLATLMDQNPHLPAKRDFATGFTALHWGAKLGRKDLVRLIADTGIDINYKTHGGQTALHLAAMHGYDDIIRMLLNDYSADVHARDYAGRKAKDFVKDTVSPDLQRKLGRSLILDPNIHLISGIARNAKDDHFTRLENEDLLDAAVTPETRRRLRTMSFLKKKKKPTEKCESDEENERQKRTMRPKSSIVLLTPEMEAKYRHQSKSMTSFENLL